MAQEAKIIIGIAITAIVLVIAAALFMGGSSDSQNNFQKADPKLLMRNDSNKTGSAPAKITLVEFGDYQCPACKTAHPALKNLMQNYNGKILFVFRNFPLSMHKNARIAAQAAEAAGKQGKYWEMHDKLYENQSQWAENTTPLDNFLEYAKDLHIDMSKFKEDVQKNLFEPKIQQDLADGNSLGVNATPTFYINGEKILIVSSYNELKDKIESELKKEN